MDDLPAVRLINDPVLRKHCRGLGPEDIDMVKELLPVMFAVMKREGGIGLAANQIGHPIRLFVLGLNGEEHFINPTITAYSRDEVIEFEEGCLSIPGTSGPTKRYREIKLQWETVDRVQHEAIFCDKVAIAIQHEMDHLNGLLYVDQLGPMRRRMVIDKHKKYIKQLSRDKE